MLRLRIGEDKTVDFGEDITIETDGTNVVISDGKTDIRTDYDSPLEMLYVIMWMMKKSHKTTLIFKEGKREFVRTKKYKTYRDSIRL